MKFKNVEGMCTHIHFTHTHPCAVICLHSLNASDSICIFGVSVFVCGMLSGAACRTVCTVVAAPVKSARCLV